MSKLALKIKFKFKKRCNKGGKISHKTCQKPIRPVLIADENFWIKTKFPTSKMFFVR
jgi:hypothetical protein